MLHNGGSFATSPAIASATLIGVLPPMAKAGTLSLFREVEVKLTLRVGLCVSVSLAVTEEIAFAFFSSAGVRCFSSAGGSTGCRRFVCRSHRNTIVFETLFLEKDNQVQFLKEFDGLCPCSRAARRCKHHWAHFATTHFSV